MSFGFEKFKLRTICRQDSVVGEIRDGDRHNSIRLVVIDNEKANVAVEGHERKGTGKIRI